jgi:hypothetical protein
MTGVCHLALLAGALAGHGSHAGDQQRHHPRRWADGRYRSRRMRAAPALAAVLLLASCAGSGSPGAPGSVTARLNGQADFFAGVSGATIR